MKKVTIEQFLAFDPCYSEEQIRELAGTKNEWTSLDILALDIPPEDRLWAVLREEFIDDPILHEFSCRCAERALSRVKNPDPRSLQAIEAKRAWLRGEITNQEMAAARAAAWCATKDAKWDAAQDAVYAAWNAAWCAARDAAWCAALAAARCAAYVARNVTWSAAQEAAWCAAQDAAQNAACAAARNDAYAAECLWQINELKKMLEVDE